MCTKGNNVVDWFAHLVVTKDVKMTWQKGGYNPSEGKNSLKRKDSKVSRESLKYDQLYSAMVSLPLASWWPTSRLFCLALFSLC